MLAQTEGVGGDAIEFYGSEHWPAFAGDDPTGVLDVDLDTPGAMPVFMCGPQWQEAERDAFAATEIWPRIVRLREHGPEPDGWYRVSTGHWQLTLVTRYLPEL